MQILSPEVIPLPIDFSTRITVLCSMILRKDLVEFPVSQAVNECLECRIVLLLKHACNHNA